MHRMVHAAVLVFVVQSSLLPQEREWKCRSHGGKGDRTFVVQQAHPLEWFGEHLREFNPEVAWRAGKATYHPCH